MKEILHPAMIKMFLAIKEEGKSIPSRIAIKTNITYSHVVKKLNIFEKKNFIERNKQGRRNYIILTEKGKELKTNLLNVMRIWDEK